MTPAGQRVSAVIPACAVRYTYFSQSVRITSVEISAGIDARSHAARKARARALVLPAHLAEDDAAEKRVRDDAGPGDRREDLGDPTQDVAGAEDGAPACPRCPRRSGWTARRCPGPTTGRMAAAALSVSNDFTQNSTRSAGAQAVDPVDRGSAHRPLALHRRGDPQAMRANGGQVSAARHERDLLPRAGELRAEEAAGATRPHHDDAHAVSSRSRDDRWSL